MRILTKVRKSGKVTVHMIVTWRFFVIALAVLCFANSSLIFLLDDPHALSRASALLSIAAGTALLASLRWPIRRFTLAVAGVSLWIQAVELLSPLGADAAMSLRLTAGAILILGGAAALSGWVRAIRPVWPEQWWQVPLI